jgi:hypothetical protein
LSRKKSKEKDSRSRLKRRLSSFSRDSKSLKRRRLRD